MKSDLHVALLAAVDEGLVTRRTKGPLAIYNYTHACQYSRAWTPTTMAARGLILEESTSEVVARPFEKFFNVDERPETAAGLLPWDEPHEVSEKMDGSLGIVYCYDGKWDIVTRGAFDSPQAVYARENLLPRYDLRFAFPAPVTVMTEIIYPAARREHVVDYGERDELVFLAAMNYPGCLVGEQRRRAGEAGMGLARLAEVHSAKEAPNKHPPNSEGYVIYWPGRDLRVKVKSEEYVAAHRMLGQVTPRRVLDLMRDGKDDDILARLPEHVRAVFEEVRGDLGEKLMMLTLGASVAFNSHRRLLDQGRKEFAVGIRDLDPTIRAMCFAHADGKGPDAIYGIAWKAVAKGLKDDTEADP